MASGPWMVIGVPVTSTASYDTWINSTVPGQGYVKGQDCAFLGIPMAGANDSSSFWTSGSDQGGAGPNDDAMFTPYPTGSEGGKLYFATPEAFNNPALTGSWPDRANWADLTADAAGDPGYLIVTPFNSPNKGYFIYSFSSLTDLIDNGWRISDGNGDPLSKTKWDNTINSSDWLNSYGLDINGANSQQEQIVACTIAGTPGSKQIQGGTLEIKGAVLVAFGGAGQDYSSTGYIVPFADRDVSL